MSWQECAAEHCHSDSSPDGRYCAACADQMVATGRPMQLAWRLLKANPSEEEIAALLQASSGQDRMQRASQPCATAGCNEAGTQQRPGQYEGEGGKWYCPSCYDNMMQEDRINLFRIMGVPLPEDGGE